MLQIQAAYCLRGYVTETATQLFCLKLAMCAKYHISNIWTILFNIKYPSPLTKEQPVKTVQSSLFWWQLEMTATNLHEISVPQIKCLTTEWWPHFPALKVYFMRYNLTVLQPIMPMKPSQLLVKTDISETVKYQGEMWDNELTFVELGSVTGTKEARHT